jgi:predicted outer membrane repeat protein
MHTYLITAADCGEALQTVSIVQQRSRHYAVCLPCVLRSTTNISGGAIYSFSGDNVTVIGSDLSNNQACFGGGAIYVEKATRLTLFRSSMSGNTAGE